MSANDELDMPEEQSSEMGRRDYSVGIENTQRQVVWACVAKGSDEPPAKKPKAKKPKKSAR